MSIGIYKITNKINGKCYIGQSVNIERRWNSHKTSNEKYPLYFAFSKYGLENFSFEILEECSVSELDQKEEYYIDEFNSFENGYNLTKGGKNPTFQKLSPSLVENITNDLLNSDKTILSISLEYGIGNDFVSMINNGKAHVRDIDYPIRKTSKEHKCLECSTPISFGSTRCVKCHSIFQRVVKDRPDKETLLKEVLKDGFASTGKKYGVTDNTIKKWMKAYELPHRMKDLKPKKEEVKKEEVKDFKLRRNDEDFTFGATDDFVQYALEKELSVGTRSNIKGCINRVLRGKRKSYLGFELTE